MCYCENYFKSLIICLLLVLSFPFFNTIHFYSMPSDSKLHVSFSKNSSDSKSPIYEKQMERKREKLLKKDEYIKEG